MSPLDQLIALSHQVGAPALDAAILGEGNTSIRVDAETFLVKASGCQLGTMTKDDVVHLRFDRILALLAGTGAVDETRLAAAYEAAKVDPRQAKRPSVETVFHAVALSLPGVEAVAHTHPAAVNMLTCSPGFPGNLEGRLFPDEVVVLGQQSLFVPYIDPGVVLARTIRDLIEGFRTQHGGIPKSIYMQNHGFIALGKTPTEAVNITAMAIKAARIRLGAIQAGGMRRLDAAVATGLANRPDEKYREKLLAGGR
jgi:rhamnose utilization protein RhaD (predicted bifunctional aldolase and dehydrogenase)